jgi:hypothetical protein
MTPSTTNTYFATSAFTDLTNWSGFLTSIAGLLTAPELGAVLPQRYAPYFLLVAGVLTLFSRTFLAVRPVAAISPGETKAVEVKTL